MQVNTAVVYARFSCSKQREASIEDQLRVCTRWCADNGYAIVGTYIDRAYSGRTDERPEFQRMIANAGESEIVLVYMMDRFSRDIYDAPIYKKKLLKAGVRVVSATEAMPDGPEAMLVGSMYEALAAMESAKISQRTRRGMEGNALKCMHNGVPVYGYRFGADGRYEVDEEQAANVRDAFRLRVDGHTENYIAGTLAARGVRTSQGNPAGHTFVRRMLRNSKYIGVYSWGDTVIEGGMPAIVDREVFDMAQDVRSAKQRKSECWTDYPLSGKALCGACTHQMVGVSGRGRNGAKYEYYRCGAKCGTKPIRRDELEPSVVDGVRAILDDREASLAIARAIEPLFDPSEAEAAIKRAQERQRKAEKGIRNLTDAVADGMPYADAKPEIERLKIEYAAAAGEIAMQQSAARFDIDDFADFLQFGATLDDEALLQAFVYQVWVDDDAITVTLNYDVADDEPARFAIDRVSHRIAFGSKVRPKTKGEPAATCDDGSVLPDVAWLPRLLFVRNTPIKIGLCDGRFLFRFARAS